jgi:phage tail tape-measure protein
MAKSRITATNDDEPSGMGMVGGAAAGAAAGSLVGPLGAAIGAVVGGAVGSRTHAKDVKAAIEEVKKAATSKPAKKAMKAVGTKIAAIPAAARSLISRARPAKGKKPMPKAKPAKAIAAKTNSKKISKKPGR